MWKAISPSSAYRNIISCNQWRTKHNYRNMRRPLTFLSIPSYPRFYPEKPSGGSEAAIYRSRLSQSLSRLPVSRRRLSLPQSAVSEDLGRSAGGDRRQGLLYGARHPLCAPRHLVLGGHRGGAARGSPLPHRLGWTAGESECPTRI